MLWLCKDIPSTVHYCCNCTCNCFFNDRFGPSTLVSFVHCLWLRTRAITGRQWEKSTKPMSRWDKPWSLDRKNYVLNHDVHGRWDNPESSDNWVRMYVRDDVCVSHAPSMEGNEKSPEPMSRWDKPSSLDRKNYVLKHDVHGRWDNPESSDNCVKYVCQRWCMCVKRYVNVYQYIMPMCRCLYKC